MDTLPSCDLDRGNQTALLPDAPDELDAFHQPQGLVEHSLRRVRRVRRVDLQFVTALLLFTCRIPHCICLKNFGDLIKARAGLPASCPSYLLLAPEWQIVEI